MIRMQNLRKQDIQAIGAHVAQAFLAEPGCFQPLSLKDATTLFTLVVETCYEAGHLYTTSPRQEGYLVYWTKKERPGMLIQLQLGWKMMTRLPLKVGMVLKDGQSCWKPTEKRYKHNEDFVEVFLIAVRKEYQGQGHFRKMLEEPFTLAKEHDTICVLDTDSITKAEKYCHVGMHIVDRKVQKSGIEMFALEK